MQFIDLKSQYHRIENNIKEAINTVLMHGQYIMGPEINQLESMLSKFIGVKHTIVNASGTDALLMALMSLNIKPGDEIITTPFSFFATVEVIALLHAVPVFVDICPKTYNLDVNHLEKAITSKTKAIMPVSLYGQCADMNEINTIAKQYGLPVIEDAAQSFGAMYQGKRSCGISTIGCTSFFPSKPLGGYGDSGACFTDDDILAERLKEIRIHGQSGRYIHSRLGINGRMDTIQAAILIEKMAIFEEEIKLRQQIADRYTQYLQDTVLTPIIQSGNTSVFAQYTIEVENRSSFIDYMTSQGIPTAVHYPGALHLQKAMSYLHYQEGDFPIAEKAAENVVSLPMHPYLDIESQDLIIQAVINYLNIKHA